MQILRISVILFTGIFFSAQAQESIKIYVQENTIAVTSIDPAVTDYSDLAKIGEAIGNARVVMLGEQDHGDAPAFLAKTRLIKYLHEQKGFDVLAFESDFFALNYGWDKLVKTSPVIDSFLYKNIFPIWTDCNTCSELFYRYIPATYQTSSPLHISGFDNQMILDYSGARLVQAVDSLLMALDVPLIKQPEYKTTILPMINMLKAGYGGRINKSRSYRESLTASLKEIQQQVSAKLAKDDFWRIVMDNLVASADEYLTIETDRFKGGNIRDTQMAANLKWLVDSKYPDKKIIVWAASAHISKQVTDYYNNPSKSSVPMGYLFCSDTAKLNITYTIGFSSYKGTAGRLTMPKPYTLGVPDANGFENWVNPSYDYAFTDFKKYNSANNGSVTSFHAKMLSHYTYKTNWANTFDGVFFIRNMYPCKK